MEYLIALGLFILAIIAAFFQGKQSGKDSTTSKAQNEVLDNAKQAKEIREHIDTLSDIDIRDRLRQRNK
jgi:septal ring-binding cell division protein DamX